MKLFKSNTLFHLCAVILCSFHFRSAIAQSRDADVNNLIKVKVIDPIKKSYNTLTPKGKFVTGAFVGFTSSRVLLGFATKMIKLAAITYIGTEVLDKAGLLKVPELSIENQKMIQHSSEKLKRTVNGYRIKVKKSLSPKRIRSFIDTALAKERMATTGFATGATFGFLL